MTNYTELVKPLRCENTGDDECGSSDCPYWSGLGCMDGQLMEDAAAEIEALQAQLPKRGEWKITTEHFTPELICSKCGVHIPCVAGWCMDAHMNYCPNCGAKMEVQDA